MRLGGLARRVVLRTARSAGCRWHVNGEGAGREGVRIEAAELFAKDEDLTKALHEMDLSGHAQLLPVLRGLADNVHGQTRLSDAQSSVLLSEAARRVREADEADVRKELQLLRQLFSEVKKAHEAGSLSYSCAVVGCATAGELELCSEYLGEAEQAGLKLSVDAWNAAAALHGVVGADIQTFLRRMRDAGAEPNSGTATSLLTVLRDSRRGPEALRMLNGLRRKDGGGGDGAICAAEPQHYTLALQALVAHFADSGQWGRLAETVLSMIRGGLEIRWSDELPTVTAAALRRTRSEPSPEVAAEVYSVACEAWDYSVAFGTGADVSQVVVPPLGCVHAMLRLCEQQRDGGRADRIIELLRSAGEEPTDIMLAHVAAAHGEPTGEPKAPPEQARAAAQSFKTTVRSAAERAEE
eukprot:TRINITY_DN32373_c0_g1_i1.p1 TRINITY_DN32373_c0_g1~~TRINITY_DN32373_c0_g1_i1.p1  ORF type:complete len:411 (+),score=137.45 TRINITY_DN32373_c0_g1_i1:55-1287(+)